MEPSDLLRYTTDVIKSLGLRYFVTGSTVTIFYGEPAIPQGKTHGTFAWLMAKIV
jgi:hypothetical protein